MAHFTPSYYTRGSIEVWDFVRDQDLNYFLGNAIKYICRAGHKHDKAQDLSKAIHYLENELQSTLSESKPYGDGGAIPHSLQFDCDV
jgi:hypothetical protein